MKSARSPRPTGYRGGVQSLRRTRRAIGSKVAMGSLASGVEGDLVVERAEFRPVSVKGDLHKVEADMKTSYRNR